LTFKIQLFAILSVLKNEEIHEMLTKESRRCFKKQTNKKEKWTHHNLGIIIVFFLLFWWELL